MSNLESINQELQAEILSLKKRIRELEQLELDRLVDKNAFMANKDLFEAFVVNCPGIASIKDEEGRYIYLSKSYEGRFGVKLGDWCGKTDFDLWPLETAREVFHHDILLLQNGHPVDAIELKKETDGTITHWWNFKFPFHDASGRIYVGDLGIDITEKKRTDEQTRRTEMMEVMRMVSGGLAHTLNNVLGLMIGFSEVLLDHGEDTPHALKKILAMIMDSGQKVATIVQDLLTMTRTSAAIREPVNQIVFSCYEE